MCQLTPPATKLELRQLCADLMSVPLDRARPLWDLTFVEGSGRGSCRPRRATPPLHGRRIGRRRVGHRPLRSVARVASIRRARRPLEPSWWRAGLAGSGRRSPSLGDDAGSGGQVVRRGRSASDPAHSGVDRSRSSVRHNCHTSHCGPQVISERTDHQPHEPWISSGCPWRTCTRSLTSSAARSTMSS